MAVKDMFNQYPGSFGSLEESRKEASSPQVKIVVPPPGLVDSLSSDRAFNIENLAMLTKLSMLLDTLNRNFLTLPSAINDKAALESGQIFPYQIFNVPLDSVLDGVSTASRRQTSGLMNVLAVGTDGLIDTVSIKLNSQQADPIQPKYVNPIPLPFYSFYVTSTLAQPGKSLVILCSNTTNPNFGTGAMAKALISGAPSTIYSAALLAAGTYYTAMVDCKGVSRVAFRINNGLDVAVTAQAITNFTNSSADADLIATPVPIASLDRATIIPAWDNWNPYMGIVLAVAAIPAAGTLSVQAVVQE